MNPIGLIESQSPFVQGLIAAALFGISIWLGRFILKKFKKAGSLILETSQKQMLFQHWLHKKFVNSDNHVYRSTGFNFVVLEAMRWILKAVFILIFFLFLNAALNKEWLWVACSWLVFNAVLEAYNWVKDTSSEKYIEKLDDNIKKDFFESMSSSKSQQIESGDKGE